MGALYTYVNARCPDDDGQRALCNKAKPRERASSKPDHQSDGVHAHAHLCTYSCGDGGVGWSARCSDLGIGCCLLRARPTGGPADRRRRRRGIRRPVRARRGPPLRPHARPRGILDAHSRTFIECCQREKGEEESSDLAIIVLSAPGLESLSLDNNLVAALYRMDVRGVLFQTFDVTFCNLICTQTKVTLVLSPLCSINPRSCMPLLCRLMLIAIFR